MTRIRDESTLAAVRSAGLAKLQPARPRIAVGMGTCGTGNGAEGVFHAFDEAIGQRGLDVQLVQTGCFGFCAEEPLVNVWVPGQPLVMLHRVRPDQVGQILDGMVGRALPESLALCKIGAVGPHHRAARLWQRLRLDRAVGRGAVLQRPEEDRAAQLWPDQPGRHRRVHRDRRLRLAAPGAARRDARAGERTAEGGAAARPWRRRLLHRRQVRIPAQSQGRSQIPDLQRRRGRPRRLHEPQRAGERSALAARGHGDRRLRDRRPARHRLCPCRVPAGGAPAQRRHRAGPGVRPAG